MTTRLTHFSFRTRFLLGFLACVALLMYAVFVQIHDRLEPCPLCIFQRVAFAALGVVLLIGGLHAPKGRGGRRAYGVVATITSLVGIVIAGNHVRLQHLPPDQVPACGPGLDYMLDVMPVSGVIRRVMTGSGECANVDWAFLGISMPGWSLLCFVVLAGWAGHAAFRTRPSR